MMNSVTSYMLSTTQCIPIKHRMFFALHHDQDSRYMAKDKVHKGKWTGRELPVEGVGALMTSQFI